MCHFVVKVTGSDHGSNSALAQLIANALRKEGIVVEVDGSVKDVHLNYCIPGLRGFGVRVTEEVTTDAAPIVHMRD